MTCTCSKDTPLGYQPCPFHANREKQAYERALKDAHDELHRHAADPRGAEAERAALRAVAPWVTILYTQGAQEELALWRADPEGYHQEVAPDAPRR